MHARVVISQMQLAKVDEGINLVRDSVAPAAKQQQGFKGILSLADRNTGKGISITMWETEADMKAGEASGYLQEQIAKFSAIFAAPPTTEHYEVIVQV
ncbi:hypothetical protein ES703_12569 [subsurface metagenome]